MQPDVVLPLREALRRQHLGPVIRAAALLIAVGTIVYSLGNGWGIVDGFYFAVATLTTSTIADPDLGFTDAWLKLFTCAYILVGVGILVEIARRIATSFVAVRRPDARRPGP